LTTIVSPLTCTLHYGLFDDANRLDMRITFDHRAIDGAPVARALTEMEEVLITDIHTEIEQLPDFGFRISDFGLKEAHPARRISESA
jgi:hypothetical protein